MIRTVTKSAARCRRRTPDGAPEGATPSQEGVQIKDCRAIWRAVPSPFGRGNPPKLGRNGAARTMTAN